MAYSDHLATNGSPANGHVHPASAIDLRSDTITKPSPAMREAMASAVVGDDVYGDDPTVLELQEEAARIVGKEAAIWVASGTMGNLAAVLAHCRERGSEVIVGDESHVYQYEAGGMSVLGGVAFNVVQNAANGELPLGALAAAVRADDQHCAVTSLVCIENTQNRCGGAVLSLDYMRRLRAWADSKGLPIHLDGARVFNAAAALGVDVREITSLVDTVQFCLSKGLGAPAGSIVAGPAAFIKRVHRLRKMLGGGMRQVGVLAAPGLIALKDMSKRLGEDHAKAQVIAQALAKSRHVSIDPALVQSNIVVFRLREGAPASVLELVEGLRQEGVLCCPFRDGIRFVTHHQVSSKECAKAALTACQLLEEPGWAHALREAAAANGGLDEGVLR